MGFMIRLSVFLRFFLYLFFLGLFPENGIAQINKDPGIGASIGLSNYMGDLDDHLGVKFSKPGFGFHILKPLKSRLSVRLNYLQTWIHADDASGFIANNRGRNLNFKSPISELSFTGLFYLRSNIRRSMKHRKANAYFFVGVAGFKFNPTGTANGKSAKLQPLGTEGQYIGYGKPYSLYQVAIPFGGGIHYRVSKMILIGVESGFRKTFTDYLDDVSKVYPDQAALYESNPTAAEFSNKTGGHVGAGSVRGNPLVKDSYLYTNINITFFPAWLHYQVDINRKCRDLK